LQASTPVDQRRARHDGAPMVFEALQQRTAGRWIRPAAKS
jgi:hypothetical protein